MKSLLQYIKESYDDYLKLTPELKEKLLFRDFLLLFLITLIHFAFAVLLLFVVVVVNESLLKIPLVV